MVCALQKWNGVSRCNTICIILWHYVYLALSICLSVYLSTCLSVCLSIYPSNYLIYQLPICLPISISNIYLPTDICPCLLIPISICLSVWSLFGRVQSTSILLRTLLNSISHAVELDIARITSYYQKEFSWLFCDAFIIYTRQRLWHLHDYECGAILWNK
jgi:hypothetical protein